MPSSATGLEKILADLKRLEDAVSGPGLASIMTEAGQAGTQEAQARVRVRTGALRSSIHWEQQGNTAGKLGSNLDYAAAQEFGTSRFSGQAYITPGAEVTVAKIKEGLDKAVKSGTV
jgi:HK97 gp10 family phage protein